MITGFDPISNPAFDVLEPEHHTAPFVLNSPHSGRVYPPHFLDATRLGNLAIRKSEDFLVDEVASRGVASGLPLLSANFPRAYLDVNREPYELDPTMFDGKLPDHANIRSLRVSSGLGTIAKIVAEGEEIYKSRLAVEDGLARVEEIYKPYHATLRQLLAQTHVKFGCAVLIDCHSMPSSSAMMTHEIRPDFVLGDRFGSSCSPQITHFAKILLEDMGYYVEINKPYAGGFITEHYGRPDYGLHALQIEMNRGLYMDETRILPSADFEQFANTMDTFFSELVAMDCSNLPGSIPLAAE